MLLNWFSFSKSMTNCKSYVLHLTANERETVLYYRSFNPEAKRGCSKSVRLSLEGAIHSKELSDKQADGWVERLRLKGLRAELLKSPLGTVVKAYAGYEELRGVKELLPSFSAARQSPYDYAKLLIHPFLRVSVEEEVLIHTAQGKVPVAEALRNPSLLSERELASLEDVVNDVVLTLDIETDEQGLLTHVAIATNKGNTYLITKHPPEELEGVQVLTFKEPEEAALLATQVVREEDPLIINVYNKSFDDLTLRKWSYLPGVEPEEKVRITASRKRLKKTVQKGRDSLDLFLAGLKRQYKGGHGLEDQSTVPFEKTISIDELWRLGERGGEGSAEKMARYALNDAEGELRFALSELKGIAEQAVLLNCNLMDICFSKPESLVKKKINREFFIMNNTYKNRHTNQPLRLEKLTLGLKGEKEGVVEGELFKPLPWYPAFKDYLKFIDAHQWFYKARKAERLEEKVAYSEIVEAATRIVFSELKHFLEGFNAYTAEEAESLARNNPYFAWRDARFAKEYLADAYQEYQGGTVLNSAWLLRTVNNCEEELKTFLEGKVLASNERFYFLEEGVSELLEEKELGVVLAKGKAIVVKGKAVVLTKDSLFYIGFKHPRKAAKIHKALFKELVVEALRGASKEELEAKVRQAFTNLGSRERQELLLRDEKGFYVQGVKGRLRGSGAVDEAYYQERFREIYKDFLKAMRVEAVRSDDLFSRATWHGSKGS